MAIMLKFLQSQIIQLNKVILKHGKLFGLLELARPNFQLNISLIKDRWVEYLAITETAKFGTTCNQ